MNSGITLSQSLYLATGIACRTLRPTRYFMNTMLTSPTSMALDCDKKRFNRSALSVACILIVKPRSLLACSPIFGIAATGGPAWSKVTSLMSCAQIVGNPVSTPDPPASPAKAALPFNSRRRVTRGPLARSAAPVPLPDIVIFLSVGWMPRLCGAANVAAAAHQWQDARAELLHADHEIIKGQHHAAHPRHRSHFVEHPRDRGVGADEHALIGRQLLDAEGPAPVRLRIRILVGIVFRLSIAPGQRLDIGAGFVMLPLRHRRGIGLVGNDHLQDQGAAVAPGFSRRIDKTRDTRSHRPRLIDPAAGAEVVVGKLRGKAGPGVTLRGADDRDFAGRHRQAPAIVHLEEIALQVR